MIATEFDENDPPDVDAHDLGDDMWILDLRTLAARLWVQQHLPAPREWWCGSLIYRGNISALAARMEASGLYLI